MATDAGCPSCTWLDGGVVTARSGGVTLNIAPAKSRVRVIFLGVVVIMWSVSIECGWLFPRIARGKRCITLQFFIYHMRCQMINYSVSEIFLS